MASAIGRDTRRVEENPKPGEHIPTPGRAVRHSAMRNVLLGCGILSSLLYVTIVVLAPSQWEGYSSNSQTVGELIAIGAPTRPLVASLMVAAAVLLYAFGVGVWQTAGRKRPLRVAAVGMVGKEVLGVVVTLFFPMHLREVLAAGGATLTDELHRDLTIAGVLFMLVAMVAGAAALGWRFRLYTIGTILLFVVGGISAFGDGPRMAADLPTPWMGVTERINAFGYMAWLSVLAIALLRAEAARPLVTLVARPNPDHPLRGAMD